MPEFDSTIEYRDVPGFPGYKVGNDGTVWTCWRGKLPPYLSGVWKQMRPQKAHNGYLRIGLRRNGRQEFFAVHCLVLFAFVGPCPPEMECRHFPSRDKANNCLSNLQWGTRSENANDRFAHGTHLYGEKHPLAKLTLLKVAEIRRRCQDGEFQRILANEFGVTQAAISLIVRKAKWKHLHSKQLTA